MSRGDVLAVDFSFSGDEPIKIALQRLAGKEQLKAFKASLRAPMKAIVMPAMKARVPVKTGRLRGSLKVRALRSRRGVVGIRVKTGDREELGIPYNATGYYPMSLERGYKRRAGFFRTVKVPARPYAAPALKQNEDRVIAMFSRELGTRVGVIWGRV